MREKNRSGRGRKHPSTTDSKGTEQGEEAAKLISDTEKPAVTGDQDQKKSSSASAGTQDPDNSGKDARETAATPEKSSAGKGEPPAPPPPPQPQKGGGCGATALALLALLLSLGVGGAGYYLWQQLQTGQQQTVQNLQQTVASRIGEVSSTLQQQNEQKFSSVEQQVSSLKGEIEALGKQQQELRALQQETALQEMAALNEKIGAIGSSMSAAEQRLAELTTQQQGVAGRVGEADATLQKLAAVGESIAALEAKVEAAAGRQQQLLDSIAALQIQADQERNSWKLGEAEYLLKVATRRLSLEHDIGGAAAALQAADDNLAEIGDSRWLPVRQAISAALTDLQALPKPDIDGAAVTIAALDKAVDQLPLQQPERQLKSTALNTESLHQAEDLQSWGGKVWESVKKLVVIRRGEKPAMMALLPPDQSEYLRQNLHLKLENARYALLRGNPELFRKSLGIAREWIEAHFDTQAEATGGMLESLQKLQGMEFPRTLPDISAPLEQLRKLRSRGRPVQQPPAQPESAPGEPEQVSGPEPQEQPEPEPQEQPEPEPQEAESESELQDAEQQETDSQETDQQEQEAEPSPDAATVEGAES